jgi:hypothetical protein
MNYFFKKFNNLVRLKCTWHLIRNIREAVRKGKGGGTFEDDDIWRIQGSRTAEEYNHSMSALTSKCRAAGVYLSTVDKRDWVNYAMWSEHEVHTFGLKTNQQAESINGANVDIRKQSCVALVIGLLDRECDNLSDIRAVVINPDSTFVKKNKLVTPVVEMKLAEQFGGATNWRTRYISDTLGTVDHSDWTKSQLGGFYAETTVNLTNRIACDNALCDHQQKYMMHCCHVFAFLRDINKLEWETYVQQFIPVFMRIEAYIAAYSHPRAVINPILKGNLIPRVLEGPLPQPAGNVKPARDAVEEELEGEEGGDENRDFLSMESVKTALGVKGFVYKLGDQGVGFYKDEQLEVDEEWLDGVIRRGGVRQGAGATTASTTTTSTTTTSSSTPMLVESPFAAAFAGLEAAPAALGSVDEFAAAFGGTPDVTASKKPASMKGSSKAKVRKLTHPPVTPNVALMAYGAPSVLPPPGPKPKQGKPSSEKRYRNKGGPVSDGGRVFRGVNPGNREEPAVDAFVRRQRPNAGVNPWMDNR